MALGGLKNLTRQETCTPEYDESVASAAWLNLAVLFPTDVISKGVKSNFRCRSQNSLQIGQLSSTRADWSSSRGWRAEGYCWRRWSCLRREEMGVDQDSNYF